MRCDSVVPLRVAPPILGGLAGPPWGDDAPPASHEKSLGQRPCNESSSGRVESAPSNGCTLLFRLIRVSHSVAPCADGGQAVVATAPVLACAFSLPVERGADGDSVWPRPPFVKCVIANVTTVLVLSVWPRPPFVYSFSLPVVRGADGDSVWPRPPFVSSLRPPIAIRAVPARLREALALVALSSSVTVSTAWAWPPLVAVVLENWLEVGSDFPLVLFTSVSQFKALLADEDALALHVSAQAPVLNAAKRPRASSDADGPTPPNSPSRFPPFDAAAASAQVAPAHVETASAHAVAVLSARIDQVESSASGTYASFSRLQAAVTDLTVAKVRADADLATVMATLGRVQETVAASADFSACEDVKRDIAALWARVPPDVKHYLAMTNLYFYRVGEKKQLTNDGLSAAQILSEELSRFNKVLMLLKLLFPTPVLAILNGFRAHVPSNKKGDSKIPVIVAEFASSRDAEAFLVLWAKIDFDSKMWDMWTVDNKRPTCFKFSGTAPELIKPYDAFDSVILTT